jgi:phosphatidate cytidylyltransferase
VSNFWQRAITGTVFVIVMVGCMMWSYWSLCALFFLISMLGLNELYSILNKHGNLHPQKSIGMAVGAILFLLFAFRYQFTSELIFTMMIPLLVAIFFVELYRKRESPFINISVTILGIIYVVLPFALWVNFVCPYTTFHNQVIDQLANAFLPAIMYNPHILLGYFFILWTNDTGAYITGRTMGKHKLWERISPKKTWEGFIGGIVLSIAVGYLISHYYTELSPILWMTIGLLVGVFGTLGDLVESMFKRSVDVKESGGILPGHGGILDRFDGVLLSTPVILAVIQITAIVSAMIA